MSSFNIRSDGDFYSRMELMAEPKPDGKIRLSLSDWGESQHMTLNHAEARKFADWILANTEEVKE